MFALRRFLTVYPRFAALLLDMALVMRFAVPAGFMPVADSGGFVLVPCPGAAPAPAMPMMAMADMHHGPDPAMPAEDHAKPAMPCAFAAVAMPVMAAVDAILLAIAVAVGLRIASHRRVVPRPAASPYLRPPLRGPPAGGMRRR